MDCYRYPGSVQTASVRNKPTKSFADLRTASERRFLGGSVAALCLLFTLTTLSAHAGAPDQARRITHFQWLQARGVFQSMGVVNGVPQLVLGKQRALADNNAMAVFCEIIFAYFLENNP